MLVRKNITAVLALVLVLMTGVGSAAPLAQDHLVTPQDLHQALQKKADQRQQDLDRVLSFFQSDPVRKTLRSTPLDLQQVQEAIPSLNDAELARLAERVRGVEDDIAAGALTNQQITYILIALATAVLILVLVAA